MKKLIILIVAVLVTLYILSLVKNIKDLEADITHLNNQIDIRVKQGVNDARKQVTDSLINEFELLPPIIETKIKIEYRYEKVTDTIILLPKLEQLDYISRELDRLYPNN